MTRRLATAADVPWLFQTMSVSPGAETCANIPPDPDKLAEMIERGDELWALDDEAGIMVCLVLDSDEAAGCPKDADGLSLRVWVRWEIPTCVRRSPSAAEAKAAAKLLGYVCGQLLIQRPDLKDVTCGGILSGSPLAAYHAAVRGMSAIPHDVGGLASVLYWTPRNIIKATARL